MEATRERKKHKSRKKKVISAEKVEEKESAPSSSALEDVLVPEEDVEEVAEKELLSSLAIDHIEDPSISTCNEVEVKIESPISPNLANEYCFIGEEEGESSKKEEAAAPDLQLLNNVIEESPQSNNVELDPCEEALTILNEEPTAPSNSLESGDFYSLQSKTSLAQTHLYPLNMLKEITAQEEAEEFEDRYGTKEKIKEIPKPEPLNSIQLKTLYNNYLLENVMGNVEVFCETHLLASYEGFELYELLCNYSRASNQLAGCEKSLNSLKSQCQEHEKNIWSHSTKVLSKSVQCLDKNNVIATHQIHTAHFNQKTHGSLAKSLCEMKDLVQDSFSLYAYSIKLCKTQIEHFFYKSFHHISLSHSEIGGYLSDYPNQEIFNAANLLKLSISTLFSFIRRPCTLIQPDFLKDCQEWSKRCGSLLLRIAKLEDHYFLLNHILRCPPGSISKWASPLIQVPTLPIPTSIEDYSGSFGHIHLDHCLCLLSIILKPVLKRDAFLTRNYKPNLEVAKSESRNQWVIIDSDGEDEPEDITFFKDSDLVALLQQVPFEQIFRRILFITRLDGSESDFYDVSLSSSHSILKLLALSTQLVNLLGSGLTTYYTDRYQRLIKIIGRLILHVSQYVTEHVENYFEAKCSEDSESSSQLSVEYDSFFGKMACTLIEGKNIGTLQFLAGAPFHFVSSETLWRIYSFLTKWTDDGHEDISLEFQHELIAMNESDALYLLTVMANMSMARSKEDRRFLKTVALHLFQIGFLSQITKATYSKIARDLLSNMTSKYPHLISILIHIIKQKIDVLEKMSIFLLKDLSFQGWKPTDQDFQLLSHWLLDFNTYTVENQVCRFILQSINWDFEDNKLFLPQKYHFKVALLVLEASLKWDKSQNLLSESVRQVQEIATRSNDMNFSTWIYEILPRLHLHGFDQNLDEFSFTKILRHLPTFESHPEMNHLKRAVDEKNPYGAYVALLITPLGHSLPILCSSGFDLLEILLANSKFEAVIHVLFFIVPLFVGSKEELVKNEKFQKILKNFLAADKTYMQMAKNLIALDAPGVFTKLLGEMIQSQFHNAVRFNTSERNIVRLWTESFTSLDNWNRDNNILYLLEILAQFAFINPDCNVYFFTHLTSLYNDLPAKSQSGITSFLFNWSTPSTTLLPNSSYPKLPYLCYFCYTIEMQLEDYKSFWKNLCVSLQNPKLTLDSAVKKASSSSKFSTSTNFLSIYRWSQEALELPFEHPLTLVFWQKFFLRYFHRVTTNPVTERFFDGLINSNFHKKLLARINETLDFYRVKLTTLENELNESIRKNSAQNPVWEMGKIQNIVKILNSYSLWITEDRLLSPSLYSSLPPQYSANRLLSLIEGDATDWNDLFDVDEISTSQREIAKVYLQFIKRESWFETIKFHKSHHPSNSMETRIEEILKRFNSYDRPLPPPPLPTFPQVIPQPNLIMYNDLLVMNEGIAPHLSSLTEFAESFSLQIAHHTALNCSYLEYLPNLYANEDNEMIKNVHCTTSGSLKGCSGPAHVVFKFKEARLKERVGHLIQQNRAEYNILIDTKATASPPNIVSTSAVFLEDFITNLIIFYRQATIGSEEINKVQVIGIELFYTIAGLVKQASYFYPPTRQLFSSFIEILGKEFISDDPSQCLRLIENCKKAPKIIGELSIHINLAKADAPNLLNIYGKITALSKTQSDLAFVILTKLDLASWLKNNRPNPAQSSQLILHIWNGIISQGLVPEKGNMVHDTYRFHLRIMLLYEFPQHFGEILNLLLEGSEKQSISLDVWYDFFNTLCQDKKFVFQKGMDPYTRKSEVKRFATEVDIFHQHLLFEVAQHLSVYFTKERLNHGIYGLYPKYRPYVEPLSLLVQMMTYSLITFSLKNSNGTLSQKILESIWPVIRDIYGPWLLPYDQKIIQSQCAQWVQRINFEPNSVLQPWIPNDSPLATIFVNDFTDCILFLAETLPGSPYLLSYLWNYYVENFAQSYVKDHVQIVLHKCLVSISWSIFWPTFFDVELMNKVVEKYLPSCHNFLSVIYAQINWGEWTRQLMSGPMLQVTKGHSILLNLTIRLAHDVVSRESPTWLSVMEFSEYLNWEYVQLNFLEHILNWFVMSVDPIVVLHFDSNHPLDIASLRILKIASGFPRTENNMPKTSIQFQPDKSDLSKKRYIFLRSYVRLLVTASSKYKNLIASHGKNFERGIQDAINDLVQVVKIENLSMDEFTLHLKELISLMGNHYLNIITRNSFIVWCEANNDTPLCFLYTIICLSFSSNVLPYITVPLMETCIRQCFKHKEANWEGLTGLLSVHNNSELMQYFDVSSKDGHYLVLYTLLLKRFEHLGNGGLSTVSFLTDLLKNLKPKESNESALPLIYGLLIRLSVVLLLESEKVPGDNLEKSIKKFLNGFVMHLTLIGDEKESWGILGALGIGKASPLSGSGRLFAKILSLFVMAQIPINAPVRIISESEGHFNSEETSASSPVKHNGDLKGGLEKLEGLKLIRGYMEYSEIIDASITLINEPKMCLSSCDILIEKLMCSLFSDPIHIHSFT